MQPPLVAFGIDVVRVAQGPIEGVDDLAFGDLGVQVADMALMRSPSTGSTIPSNSNTRDFDADVLDKGGAIDLPGDLIIGVVVVKSGNIEHQTSIERGVLGSHLQRVDEFGFEGLGEAQISDQRRIEAAALVAARG